MWTDDIAVKTPILTTKYHPTYLTGGGALICDNVGSRLVHPYGAFPLTRDCERLGEDEGRGGMNRVMS